MKHLIFTSSLLCIVFHLSAANSKDLIFNHENIAHQNTLHATTTNNYDIQKLDYEGKIYHKETWNDNNGKNVVLFTTKETTASSRYRSKELFVYHYVIKSGKVTLLRSVYDFIKDCDADIIMRFVRDSIAVTDLDKDGIKEITFAYRQTCASDVSAVGLKLLILGGGNKCIIRGSTIMNLTGSDKGKVTENTKKIDPSFYNYPSLFLKYANKAWKNAIASL